MSKSIAILGATGSVGMQAQDVARKRGYKVRLITANRSVAEAERAALVIAASVEKSSGYVIERVEKLLDGRLVACAHFAKRYIFYKVICCHKVCLSDFYFG